MPSVRETSPTVLRASTFKSTPKTPNSEAVKNQYYYRVMIFLRGGAGAVSENGEFDTVCGEGDVLYLPPLRSFGEKGGRIPRKRRIIRKFSHKRHFDFSFI